MTGWDAVRETPHAADLRAAYEESVRRQRDELIDALEELLAAAVQDGPDPRAREAVSFARLVLAKHDRRRAREADGR